MNKREEYMSALENVLSSANQQCRQKIMNQWEKEIFPFSDEVKEYLQHIYNNSTREFPD